MNDAQVPGGRGDASLTPGVHIVETGGLGGRADCNSKIDGAEIVEQHYYDIGVAVSSERGLMVPVIREADRLSLAAIEKSISDLAERSRATR